MVWHRVSFSNTRAWVPLSRFILLFLQMRHFFGNMCGRSLVLRASVVEERSIFRGGGAGSVSDSDSSSDDTKAAETSKKTQWDFIDYGFLGHFTTTQYRTTGTSYCIMAFKSCPSHQNSIFHFHTHLFAFPQNPSVDQSCSCMYNVGSTHDGSQHSEE